MDRNDDGLLTVEEVLVYVACQREVDRRRCGGSGPGRR